jgi:hypothetical protein
LPEKNHDNAHHKLLIIRFGCPAFAPEILLCSSIKQAITSASGAIARQDESEETGLTRRALLSPESASTSDQALRCLASDAVHKVVERGNLPYS